MSKILVRIIKLTFAMIALLIRIHNLTLSKIFTFYIVEDTFKAVTKSVKSFLTVGNFGVVRIRGSDVKIRIAERWTISQSDSKI